MNHFHCIYKHNPLEADYPELWTVQIVTGVASRSEYMYNSIYNWRAYPYQIY
jgi:hypothetical protein